jgi:sigma-B regulation protein RsbQ
VTAGQVMLFAHGFGCDQSMWRLLTPHFEDRYRIVTFDHLGLGGSDRSAYRPERYETLDGFAEDVLRLCEGLDLHDVIFVGHSVSAMIGVLAAVREPDRFASLVLVCPSPCYVDDEGYVGGFTRQDIDELLESLDANYLGWSAAMAPVVMGHPDRPELGKELTDLFCRADPDVASRFARATFLADNREDLGRLRVPALILQCREDVIAPTSVGEYVQRAIDDAELVELDTTGHCPNLSAPDLTAAAIRSYLDAPASVA